MMLVRVRVLLLARDSTRHMRKVRLSRARKPEHAAELLGLLGSLLVRVRVLLEALDAVLHFWPPETCEEHARIVA